ncbi:light-harvesting complex-like protein OHP1, chloroplastic [Salvia miltiorrhiza]|uniref:light-harvesting complex-like protein OHP1, chloroplastic n=1 Tax=Salvia miltiorrhiza TaxID=226208 RepID=UPI0025ACA912|nr:light-harvesting complex-like protein OHP1, chloroplastic [Salvia miltiorrhiza]
MASVAAAPLSMSSPFLRLRATTNNPTRSLLPTHNHKRVGFNIHASNLPAGVELPKEQPKFEAPFLGFTTTAEIWNSRACMIGLIGTFIVELILNKGILEIIGVEVGKGLDIPL